VRTPTPTGRVRTDGGGMWIRITLVLGVLVYLGMVVLLAAGFEPILPFVVVPPVVAALIAGGNLLGGRSHGRPSGRGAAAGTVPPPSGSDEAPGSE